MIKVFTQENINKDSVTKLWMHSFGDSCEYIGFFLDNCPDYVCIAECIDDKPVSMYFFLDGQLAGEKCKYLYAACTHSDYRRQGIMENLIEYGKEYCTKNGYASIFLVPANEKLYSYYSKLGFVSSFRKKIFTSCDSVQNNSHIEEPDINEVFLLKKQLLNNLECFCFSDGVLKYTIEEHLFNGGIIFLNNDNKTKQLAFYYLNGKDILVKEYLSDIFNISTDLLKVFCDKSTENIYFYTPLVYNSRDIVEEYAKCGMCLPLNEKLSDYLKKHTDVYAGMYLD